MTAILEPSGIATRQRDDVSASAPSELVAPRLAGLDVDDLAALHGTPFFLYDLDLLGRRVDALRAVLPAIADLAFAVKANPSLAVLAHLARLGVGADVASGGELETVVHAGMPVDRVVFTGPGKTDAELARALRLGVRAITVESLDEIDALIELRGVASPGQGLLLRLAIERGTEATPIISGRGAAKFGLLPAEVDEAIDRLHRSGAAFGAASSFRLLGLHAFGASNVLDADQLVEGVAHLAERAEEVGRRHGMAIRLLDGGGGLGIPYSDDQPELDLERFGRGLAGVAATFARRSPLAGARLLFEPGRWLAGPIGSYVVRVLRTKQRDGRTVAVVDGGIHQLARPALIGQGQRVEAVGATAVSSRAQGTVDVVGPLCTGLDVLATGVALRGPRAGDLLAIRDAGAYGFTESMPLFLSHPQPAEIVAAGGRAGVARLRSDPIEVVRRQLRPFG